MIKVIYSEENPLVVECTDSHISLCPSCKYNGSCNFSTKDARGVTYAVLFYLSLLGLLLASILLS